MWNLTIDWANGSAATAGNEVEVYWGASSSATAGTDNPGGLSGTDATFNTTPDEYKQQLAYVGSLVSSNNAGTGVQRQVLRFVPPKRYGMPVIVNKTGQTASATEGNFQIVLEPVEEATEDTV